MVKVSVIVPAYNAEKYIKRCLESLINQTLKDIEIIVINDGSNDKTGKILENYKHEIIIINQENAGVATARNRGLEKAKGEYIAFVDSDDWVERDFLEKLHTKAISNNYDCVMCNFWYIDDNKKWNGIITNKNDILNINSKKKFMIEMFPVIWNKIYKREKILDFRFKNGVWAEDVEFLYRIISNIDNIGILEDKLYYYFQQEVSESRLYDKRIYNYIDNFNGILEFYRNNNIYEIYKSELEYCYVRYLYATFVKRATYFDDEKEFDAAVNTAIDNVKNRFPDYRKNKYFYKSFKGIYLILFNKLLGKILYKLRKR